MVDRDCILPMGPAAADWIAGWTAARNAGRQDDFEVIAVARGIEGLAVIRRGEDGRLICETVRFGAGEALAVERPRARPHGPIRWAVALSDILLTWIDRARSRQALGGLPDRVLKDIGVSRAEAAREADKPFWKD